MTKRNVLTEVAGWRSWIEQSVARGYFLAASLFSPVAAFLKPL